ncbi:glycosyltransferase [Wenzhouxiangella sp. EGI_FJ10305]|uniref:glycosyltransferase n=1 Tax=Wenzhouxiangella sp. EGI_FJ10305 TaxID=3243768 RepID=UPI0035E13B00
MRSKRELQRALEEVGNIGALRYLLEREEVAGEGSEIRVPGNNGSWKKSGCQESLASLSRDRGGDRWHSWSLAEGVEVLPYGVLRLPEGSGRLFASSRILRLEPNSVYEVHFKYNCQNPAAEIYLTITPDDATAKADYFSENCLPVPVSRSGYNDTGGQALYFRTGTKPELVTVNLCSKTQDAALLAGIEELELVKSDQPRAAVHFDDERYCHVFASLASIPERVSCLERTVRSLYDQVDVVRVFLNEYPDVPDFLKNDPKIQVARSQIFGDQGDSGKFFWSDSTEPGVQLICDDDLEYPPDYAERMTESLKRYDWQCVVGVHSALLRQPITDYYHQNQRRVWHFRNGLSADRFCHVLGTGTVAYHSEHVRISRHDFAYRNMADIWLARIAANRDIGLVGCARPHNWLRQLDTDGHSIYEHSTGAIEACTNTGEIQTAILKNCRPLTIPKRVLSRPKVVLGIKTYDRVGYLRDCIESFLKTRSLDFQWVLIVADDGSTDGTKAYLRQLEPDVELHVIENSRRYAVGQSNTIYELAQSIGFDYGFNVDDDLIFTKSGWDKLYINAIEKSGYSHLVHRHIRHARNLLSNQENAGDLPDPVHDPSLTCVAHGDSHFDLGTGSLVTFTPETLEKAGFADEANFPIRGQWHVDYHIRCARAGCNEVEHLFDALGSNNYLEIQNYLSEDYRCAIPWGEEYKKTKDPEELERRMKVMADVSRIYVPPPRHEKSAGFQLGQVWVDKVYVLNLDRRQDRWKAISESAAKVGVPIERFSAVDGADPEVRARYEEYARRPLVSVPDDIRIDNTRDLRSPAAHHMARVAFFEQKHKRKAIGSPGAWGYLCTMIAILRDAISSGYETILVLDDDCLFHRDMQRLVDDQSRSLPEDWLLWQLGALQYNWAENAIDWREPHFYSCNGTSVGSHATVLRAEVLPLILNECERLDLPYDEGPLFWPKALYPGQCLTSYPNLIIQDVADSDISDTTAQQKRKASIFDTYRWNPDVYV